MAWSQLMGQCRVHSQGQSLSACYLPVTCCKWVTLLGATWRMVLDLKAPTETLGCIRRWMLNHCCSELETAMRDIISSHDAGNIIPASVLNLLVLRYIQSGLESKLVRRSPQFRLKMVPLLYSNLLFSHLPFMFFKK